MKYYCDIRVLPDPEISEPVLINNLMAKLHRALVLQKNGDIAISFPNVNKNLGNTMRLHGRQDILGQLLKTDWLKGLRDYCAVSKCSPVPDQCQHRAVRRLQKKSAHNKRKRSIAKGWLTEQEALQRITDAQQTFLKNPFVQLKSNSTGQLIKLFIEHCKFSTEPVLGRFNSYGLAIKENDKLPTVPWF